jgi:hypothetical protein
MHVFIASKREAASKALMLKASTAWRAILDLSSLGPACMAGSSLVSTGNDDRAFGHPCIGHSARQTPISYGLKSRFSGQAERNQIGVKAPLFKNPRSRGKGRFDGCLGAVIAYIQLWALSRTELTRHKRKRRHGMVDPRSSRSLRWHGSDELPVGGDVISNAARPKAGGVFFKF